MFAGRIALTTVSSLMSRCGLGHEHCVAFDVVEEMSGMEEKIIAIMCFKFLTIMCFRCFTSLFTFPCFQTRFRWISFKSFFYGSFILLFQSPSCLATVLTFYHNYRTKCFSGKRNCDKHAGAIYFKDRFCIKCVCVCGGGDSRRAYLEYAVYMAAVLVACRWPWLTLAGWFL